MHPNEDNCRLPLHQVDNRVTVMPTAVQNKDFGDVGVEGQAEQALKNMGEILKEAGLGYDDVVKTVILLADIGDFAAVNAVYGAHTVLPASHGHCRVHRPRPTTCTLCRAPQLVFARNSHAACGGEDCNGTHMRVASAAVADAAQAAVAEYPRSCNVAPCTSLFSGFPCACVRVCVRAQQDISRGGIQRLHVICWTIQSNLMGAKCLSSLVR